MRKFAHTLSEVLIALGVIGLLGAVVIPMASKFRPDTDKIKFLRVYDSIVKINDSIVYDNEAYPLEDGTYSYEDYPLFNTVASKFDDITLNGDNSKYCQILASLLTAQDNPTCYNEYEGTHLEDDDPHFSSKDGMDYWVYTRKGLELQEDKPYDIATYKTDVYVDINGAEGVNCIYNKDSCSQPDRFMISIKANGETLPDDDMGEYYLNTRSSFRLNREKIVPEINSGNYTFKLKKVEDDFVETCEQVKCPQCQTIAKPGYKCSNCGTVQALDDKCKAPINPCEEYYCSTCLANGDGANVVKYGESCATCSNAEERPAALDLECTEFVQNPCEEGYCPNCKKIGKVATKCTDCDVVIPFPNICRADLEECEKGYCEFCINQGYGVYIVSFGEECPGCGYSLLPPPNCSDECIKIKQCVDCKREIIGTDVVVCPYCTSKNLKIACVDDLTVEVEGKCEACEYLKKNCDALGSTDSLAPMPYIHTCGEYTHNNGLTLEQACQLYK